MATEIETEKKRRLVIRRHTSSVSEMGITVDIRGLEADILRMLKRVGA